MSHTCNGEGGGWFKALRWGVDSLYLSYPGKLKAPIEEELERLKGLAQSWQPHEQALAQFPAGEHFFEVKDKGSGLFPYVVEDNAFRIALSRRTAKSLPMAYVKVSSDYLSHVKPEEAEAHLKSVLEGLGELSDEAAVSRIDLHVDFMSGFNMEGWTRHAWVTRARSINTYAVGGEFSGWTIGLGGPISGRLYDKLLEMAVNRYRDYLPELWRQAGWTEGHVWRCEFQFRHEALDQKGLKTFSRVMENLNGLWSYATTEWLRLTIPNPEDETRSRWPIHPLWACLASVDWGTPGGQLRRRFATTRKPKDSYLYGRGFGTIISFMACECITDFEVGVARYLERVRSYHENLCFDVIGIPFDQYVAEQVAVKARGYNTILNAPPRPRETTPADYRRESDGEGYVE